MTSITRPVRALHAVLGLGLLAPACIDARHGALRQDDASPSDASEVVIRGDVVAGDAPDTSAGVPWPPAKCVSSGTRQHLWPYGETTQVEVSLGDLDGDGTEDMLAIEGEIGGAVRGRVVRGPGFRLDLGDSWFVTAMAADLNADGRPDLVVGVPWLAKVLVFVGPVSGDLTLDDATITFSAPETHNEFATWFGRSLVIADHDGDGHVDLLVTSPSYGEVICGGELAPTLFLGPFTEGNHARDEDGLSLDAVMSFRRSANLSCVGHHAWCTNDGVAFAAPNGRDGALDEATWACVALPTPIVSSTPSDCAAWPDDGPNRD